MTLLADLLCGGGKPRLRGQCPAPAPCGPRVCPQDAFAKPLGSRLSMDFANTFPCRFPRRGAAWRRRERSGKGSMPRPRLLRPPCVTPRCICQATGIPPFHGFCKYLPCLFPRRRAVWRRRETSGKGSMPRPLRPPCVTPRCICQATGIPPLHGFCKCLSLPVPSTRGGMAAGNLGEGVNTPAPPPVGCFPLKYSGGATGSPDCH